MSRLDFVAVFRGLLLVLMLAWMPAAARSVQVDPADQAEIEQLRQRVNRYFSAVHSRQFGKAGELILPRSRDAIDLSRSGNTRVSNLRILQVELDEGNGSAVVTVSRLVSAPAGRVRVKEKFRWKKEGGQWFLDPADPPSTDAEIFREYYYKKRGSPTKAKFEETVVDFGRVVQGDPVQLRFSFRNSSTRKIVVEKIHGPGRFITDRTEKRLIPAGSDGEIIVELNTHRVQRRFLHDIFVQFEPVREMVKLRITGWVDASEKIAGSPTRSREEAGEQPPAKANP